MSHEKGRLGEGGPLESSDNGGTLIVVDQSPLQQMKSRRAAALRLPPLADGRRDPHFDLYARDGAE